MTTETHEYDDENVAPPLSSVNRPVPLNSLLAAGLRLRGKTLERLGHSAKAEGWQEDAWDMYDLVGEQRFLATTLAGRLGQARFFAGRLPERNDEEIEVLTSGPAYEAFQTISGQGHALQQMVTRLGLNLFIPGDGYLVGIPEDARAGTPEPTSGTSPAAGITPIGRSPETPSDDSPFGDIDINSLEWSMRSISEIKFDQSGDVTIESDEGKKKSYRADDIALIRVWRPHPRRWWTADSPTRSSLPVLRELVGLTMHVSSQIDSRLAGAGMLLIPESADRAVRAAAGLPEDGEELSPLVEAIMEAMTTAIQDRSNASALVPVMPVVPDESIEKFRHMTFAGPLDTEARSLRDEAIRRLALGQDCPPELLLGVGGMNHWGAWLVREDVVTTHIEPPLALICDAITTQFLWPVLEQQGVEDFQQYVIWYDVDHLIMRPNRGDDAKDLHTRGAISDSSLRDATGFDETDAPEADPTDPAVILVMDLVRGAPSLIANPGLAMLVAQVRAMLDGQPIPTLPTQAEPPTEEEPEVVEEEPEEDDDSEQDGPPDTMDDPAEPPALVASSGNPVMDAIVAQVVSGQYGPLDVPGLDEERQAPRMIPLTHGGSQ